MPSSWNMLKYHINVNLRYCKQRYTEPYINIFSLLIGLPPWSFFLLKSLGVQYVTVSVAINAGVVYDIYLAESKQGGLIDVR